MFLPIGSEGMRAPVNPPWVTKFWPNYQITLSKHDCEKTRCFRGKHNVLIFRYVKHDVFRKVWRFHRYLKRMVDVQSSSRFPFDLGQDEEIVKMVARMNELTEISWPSVLTTPSGSFIRLISPHVFGWFWLILYDKSSLYLDIFGVPNLSLTTPRPCRDEGQSGSPKSWMQICSPLPGDWYAPIHLEETADALWRAEQGLRLTLSTFDPIHLIWCCFGLKKVNQAFDVERCCFWRVSWLIFEHYGQELLSGTWFPVGPISDLVSIYIYIHTYTYIYIYIQIYIYIYICTYIYIYHIYIQIYIYIYLFIYIYIYIYTNTYIYIYILKYIYIYIHIYICTNTNTYFIYIYIHTYIYIYNLPNVVQKHHGVCFCGSEHVSLVSMESKLPLDWCFAMFCRFHWKECPMSTCKNHVFMIFLHICHFLKRKQDPQVGHHLQLAGPRTRLEFANGMQTRCMSMWNWHVTGRAVHVRYHLTILTCPMWVIPSYTSQKEVWIILDHREERARTNIRNLLELFRAQVAMAALALYNLYIAGATQSFGGFSWQLPSFVGMWKHVPVVVNGIGRLGL